MAKRHRWDEAKHPRDQRGRFANHPGGGWLSAINDRLPTPTTAKESTQWSNDVMAGTKPPTAPATPGALSAGDRIWHNSHPWRVTKVTRTPGTSQTVYDIDGNAHERRIDTLDLTLTSITHAGRKATIQVRTDQQIEYIPNWWRPFPEGRPGVIVDPTTGRAPKTGPIAYRDTPIEMVRVGDPIYHRGQVWRTQATSRTARSEVLQLTDDAGHTARISGTRGQFVAVAEQPLSPAEAKQMARWRNAARKPSRKPTPPADPKNPLSVYGDMLHIGSGRNSYAALKSLSQIPAEHHAYVARYMANSPRKDPGGIWVGSAPVTQMARSRDLRDEQPRGWDKGDTFENVNGVYRSHQRTVSIGLTNNTLRRPGGTADTARHEFGHALDDALGDRDHTEASSNADWRDLHERIKADAGPRLSPYYRQPGQAGAQEFWAEAFHIWTRDLAIPGTMAGHFGFRDEGLDRELIAYFDRIHQRIVDAGLEEK